MNSTYLFYIIFPNKASIIFRREVKKRAVCLNTRHQGPGILRDSSSSGIRHRSRCISKLVAAYPVPQLLFLSKEKRLPSHTTATHKHAEPDHRATTVSLVCIPHTQKLVKCRQRYTSLRCACPLATSETSLPSPLPAKQLYHDDAKPSTAKFFDSSSLWNRFVTLSRHCLPNGVRRINPKKLSGGA